MTEKHLSKASLKQSANLQEIIKEGKRTKQELKTLFGDNDEKKRLTITELFDLKKLKFPPNVWKDGRKLEKLLYDIVKTVNTLTKCAC